MRLHSPHRALRLCVCSLQNIGACAVHCFQLSLYCTPLCYLSTLGSQRYLFSFLLLPGPVTPQTIAAMHTIHTFFMPPANMLSPYVWLFHFGTGRGSSMPIFCNMAHLALTLHAILGQIQPELAKQTLFFPVMQNCGNASGHHDFELTAQLYQVCMANRESCGVRETHNMETFQGDMDKIIACKGVCSWQLLIPLFFA